MRKVKALGHHGSWFADVNGEPLPCVHKHWWTGDRYHDPKCRPGEKQWDDLIAAIVEKQRVILTEDNVIGTTIPSFVRTGYIAVYAVADITVDSEGLQFRFVKRLIDLN